MILGRVWWMLALAGACAGEGWWWEGDGARAASVRIDTKVRFVDDDASTRHRHNDVQADEIKEPTDTDGFYNRPAGAGSGRYPVRSEPHRQRLTAQHDSPHRYQSDGTLDSLQYCKCVSTPECTPRTDLPQACASGMFLCCYKRPSKTAHGNTEFFNELDDERPTLLPHHENRVGPFPAAPFIDSLETSHNGAQQSTRKFGSHQRPVLVGPNGPTGVVGPNQPNPGVLSGPEGPNGVVGPNHRDDRVLTGPGGPTGVIGPNHQNPGVLVGPEGPSGHIGPMHSPNRDILLGSEGPTGQIGSGETAQRGLLVGPGGPTGVLGPQPYGQRQVLVGPGGPTGMIGPGGRGGRRQSVLAGPGGPTGIIGPYGYQGGRSTQPGLLVGPGGPTGIIGPGRRLLVGPGGPTGQIGPRGYGQFGY